MLKLIKTIIYSYELNVLNDGLGSIGDEASDASKVSDAYERKTLDVKSIYLV